MKNLIKNIMLIGLTAVVFTACKKDENRVVFENNSDPITLSSSVASPSTIVLNIANKNDVAMTFSWNNPNYQFNTGISSQDVNYTLQIDTTGSNFSGKKIQERSIPKELTTSVTVGELNGYLLSMDLDFGVSHNVEIRIKSTLAGGAVPVYSNVLKYVITPYLDVKFPVPTNLFITGSATPIGWQCACGEAPAVSQQFTKINAYTFQLTLALSANNEYLFVPVYADWSAKYGFTGSGAANNVNSDTFTPGGNNIKAPAESGNYKITVDFKTGFFTLVKV